MARKRHRPGNTPPEKIKHDRSERNIGERILARGYERNIGLPLSPFPPEKNKHDRSDGAILTHGNCRSGDYTNVRWLIGGCYFHPKKGKIMLVDALLMLGNAC